MRAHHTLAVRAHWILILLLAAACQRATVSLPEQTPGADGAAATSTPERSAVLKELDGEAEVREDASGDWAATATGLVLSVGNQFRTQADSRAFIQLTEGSKIRLGPATAVTFNYLNPFLDSLLTSLALDGGETWVLLTSNSALDVETPLGIASARGAYMSVDYDPDNQNLTITCLQGTCSLNQTFIPPNYKYVQAGGDEGVLEPMQLVDYGLWGRSVPEATQFVAYATEAAAQGNATLPVAALTPTEPEPSPTPAPTAGEPTATELPPTATAEATTSEPTAAPSLTAAPLPPSSTPRPATAPTSPPPTPFPLIGQHRVLAGESVFCIARVYGVLPDAIIQANNLPAPFLVKADQTLRIPAVRWDNILAGPVCAPQFESPFPGLPYVPPAPTDLPTPAESPTAAPPLEIREVAALCIGSCYDPAAPTYRLRIIVSAVGGAEPLRFDPGQSYELDVARCAGASGTVTVTSADGQVATGSWQHADEACTPAP